MEYLYVCHFSNGHIKVGRSIDPRARIAAHADRVACMGVEFVDRFVESKSAKGFREVAKMLDHDAHAKLKAICDIDGVEMGEFIESVLLPVIEKRVHDAMMLSNELARQGITGNKRESSGVAGTRRETA